MNYTEEEILEAKLYILEKRKIELARKMYRRRLNRDPCCDREALGETCCCWQDRWC
jgi:hypothetical protein